MRIRSSKKFPFLFFPISKRFKQIKNYLYEEKQM